MRNRRNHAGPANRPASSRIERNCSRLFTRWMMASVRRGPITGNIFSTLENIDAIGNDMGGLDKGGGCGKGGQMPLPVANGGPHIRIQKCVIGG